VIAARAPLLVPLTEEEWTPLEGLGATREKPFENWHEVVFAPVGDMDLHLPAFESPATKTRSTVRPAEKRFRVDRSETRRPRHGRGPPHIDASMGTSGPFFFLFF